VGLALLLHALLLAAAVYGWMLFRSPPRPAPTLAIEATVVDARTVAGAQRPAPPQPTPPPSPPPEAPAEPQGPPPPSPEERAQRDRQRAEERQKAEAEQAQREAEEKAEQQAAQAKVAETQRKAAEAKAAQEKKAQEAKQKAEDAAEAAADEADLQRRLASEEHAAAAAASTGPALASWQAQIAARINRAWLRPPTARPGIQCMLYVTQEPGGVVTQVKIGDCNGDQAVRESIEAAVYRASPLPPPPNPALFDRNLKINFKPD
jgi:colicin import membrane protein